MMLRILSITAMLVIMAAFLIMPASGFYELGEEIGDYPCNIDDNDNHVNAERIEYAHAALASVCQADPFDWYLFQGDGYVGWSGNLFIIAPGPGLAVRLYLDEGDGIVMVYDGSPAFEPDYNMYALNLSIHTLCEDAGFFAPLRGKFYIRVTYYSNYMGEHPYLIRSYFNASTEKPPPPTTSTDALEIPVGEDRYATLTQTDFYCWYYWDHPAGEPVDGTIQLCKIPELLIEDDVDMHLKVFRNNGVLVAQTQLDENLQYAWIDLAPFNLPPGRYKIYVSLAQATNNRHKFQLRNRAVDTSGGCMADNNNSEADAYPLSPDIALNASICHPFDTADYFTYTSNHYFIGDIYVSPWNGRMMLQTAMANNKGNDLGGMPTISGLTFFREPIGHGTYTIKVQDFTGSGYSIPYEIKVAPHGYGPYQPPGHAYWTSADNVLQYDTMPNYSHDYYFELKNGEQDSYFFTAGTGPGEYLVGMFEIYGSGTDYEVIVGKLQTGGPAMGQPVLPDAYGKTILDFGYQILTDPGDYILKIKLSPSVSGQRRFYIRQTFSIEECGQEPLESFDNPGQERWKTNRGTGFTGVLCTPDDTSDFCAFSISQNLLYGIPATYNMKLKAGYPGMEFKLYDSNRNVLWSKQFAEMGDTEFVYLNNYVTAGDDYVVEVSVNSTEERLMVWSIDFFPALLPLKMEVQLYQPKTITIQLEELLSEIL